MSFEPLKNSLNKSFFQAFFKAWKEIDSNFNQKAMEESIFDSNWNKLELKARGHHMAHMIHKQLPEGFKQASNHLIEILNQLENKEHIIFSYEYFFIADYIEFYGINKLDQALEAMEEVTKFITCEFAIRPYLIKDQKKVMKQMLKWSKHKHPNVRRFSSEGCRPKLPWGMALQELIKDPGPILPILENLKADESLFVRKSVANNLNDISKNHPELVLKICKSWQNKNANTDWIIKHACRTLLKAGNPEAMKLFGYADNRDLTISNFEIGNAKVNMGEALSFNFNVKNKTKISQLVRLEYGIYFLKSNGRTNRKVFKVSEKQIKPNEEILVTKKHTIKEITTRKYYLGEQKLSLIINGIEVEETNFILY